ncbi:MAG TPA: RNA methyltransferase [Anaerolineales bacterium]|nr:RNA methyltransferase [Anaerolineales bacterium]
MKSIITSRNNSKVKQARALRQRKERQASGLFLVEGIFQVGEAVAAQDASKIRIEALYYAPDLLKSDFARELIRQQSSRGIECYATAADVFQSMAEKDNPQGILAVVESPTAHLGELQPETAPWVVAVVAPQDPGNVGTILRSIDSVGASALLLLDSSIDPFHPGAVRASMGAIFWYPLICTTFVEFAQWAAKYDYHVYGTSAHGRVDYREVQQYEHPLVLLLGSEREGLTHEQAAVCQELVRLPMRGRATSLNLAVAAGVMLYDIYSKVKLNYPI